jgi:hypothetical protein
MAEQNYTLGSYSPGLHGYAPADFLDAQETQPPQLSLDPTLTGTTTPYSQVVTNVVSRHLQEVKEKTVSPSTNGAAWRKRVKDFMIQKNEDLLGFLRKPLSNHPTLSQADHFLRKFGATNFTPTHHTLRDILMDASGTSMVAVLEEELLKVGPASSVKLTDEVRWIYDAYRSAGEQVMKQESTLKVKLDLLDKMHQKTLGLLDLPMNESTAPFQEAALSYLEAFLKEQAIEKEYTAYIEAYRRFVALKEMITTFRFVDVVDKEPLCCICLEEPVSHCTTPCGHTFCSSCVKRQVTNCYMCRTMIKDRVRIFFG